MLTRRLRAGALAVAAAPLLLSGCGGDDEPDAPAPSSASPGDLTAPGTDLSLGDGARVSFKPDAKHHTTLQVSVGDVRTGAVRDLAEFNLTDKQRKSNVVYVSGRVRNVGHGDVGGEWLKLYGKVSDTLVVQPVIFGSTFGRCDYQPLPKPFGGDKSAPFCMVFMAPKPDTVTTVEWRFDDEQSPISWAVDAEN